MPAPRKGPEQNQKAYRYVIRDRETQGIYEIVTRTSKSQEERDAIVAQVIQDEGRVAPGRRRTIYI